MSNRDLDTTLKFKDYKKNRFNIDDILSADREEIMENNFGSQNKYDYTYKDKNNKEKVWSINV